MLDNKTFLSAINYLSKLAGNNQFNDIQNEIIDKYASFDPWLNKEEIVKYFSLLSVSEDIVIENKDDIIKTAFFFRKGFTSYQGIYELVSLLVNGYQVAISTHEANHFLIACFCELVHSITDNQLPVSFTDRAPARPYLYVINQQAVTVKSRPYFRKLNRVLIPDRKSVLVINKDDSKEIVKEKARSLFDFYGLTNQSAKLIYLPKGYKIETLLDCLEPYKYVGENSHYANNYDYHKSIFLLNKVNHYDTGYALFAEQNVIQSIPSVYHFSFYGSNQELIELSKRAGAVEFIYSNHDENNSNDYSLNLNTFYNNFNLLTDLNKNILRRAL